MSSALLLCGPVPALGASIESVVVPPALLVLDSGINPYHVDFRLPKSFEPPPGYYPSEATPLELSLDAISFEEALDADRAVWEAIEYGVLYSFTGTRIVGAIDFYNPNEWEQYPLLDYNGHGTQVASAAVGEHEGACPACRLMVGAGDRRQAFEAAEPLPWLDAVSVSYSSLAGVSTPFEPFEEASLKWVHSNRSAFVAAGNGGTNAVNHLDDFSGPSWVVRVGAGDPPPRGYTRTYDVVAAQYVKVARNDHLAAYVDGAGTSLSAPAAAAYELRIVHEARKILNDDNGRDDSALASGTDSSRFPDSGPLSDGVLTRNEVERLLFLTALDVPPAVPAGALWPPFSYFWQGYGIVGEESVAAAAAVLRGEEQPREKPWEDYWRSYDQYVRFAWGDQVGRCQNGFDYSVVYAEAVADCLAGTGWNPTAGVPHVLWPLGG